MINYNEEKFTTFHLSKLDTMQQVQKYLAARVSWLFQPLPRAQKWPDVDSNQTEI